MPTENDKIIKLLQGLNKDLAAFETKYVKELTDIKKYIKTINLKITEIASKIQEFEILMDAAELLEEHMEEEENKYNTEWDPYSDDDYEPEEYEQYGDDDEELG
jgi:DNA repair exonuclease SbcCD ATPase subunit